MSGLLRARLGRSDLPRELGDNRLIILGLSAKVHLSLRHHDQGVIGLVRIARKHGIIFLDGIVHARTIPHLSEEVVA